MINTFNNFKENFEKRFNQQSILNLGEDSVRYDFFIAFMKNHNLLPHDIQIEYPINQNAYINNRHPNAKRPKNPQIDFFCMHPNKIITAEFALFKRNSKPDSSIKTTENVFKMLNDMLRLALNKIYSPNESYFICVADSKILGAQMQNNVLPAFPSHLYSFNYNDINNWIHNIDSAKKCFDEKFVEKANEIGLSITASLIYNEAVLNPTQHLGLINNLETRVIVYKIKEGNK